MKKPNYEELKSMFPFAEDWGIFDNDGHLITTVIRRFSDEICPKCGNNCIVFEDGEPEYYEDYRWYAGQCSKCDLKVEVYESYKFDFVQAVVEPDGTNTQG